MAEALQIIRTKLYKPQVATKLVERPHLINRLNQGLQRKVTLISAPAGYGKSTLATAWLHQLSCPSAWVSLDEQDNELAHFLTYLVEAIHTIYPQACSKTASFLNATQLPAADYLARSLVSELAEMSQFLDAATQQQTGLVLALDDYHLLDKPAVHTFMSFLIKYQLPGLHLVVIGRRDPFQLPLVQLRAQRALLEVRSKDLRFDLDEAKRFLSREAGMDLTEEAISALANRTEGWILGLRLASLSLRDHANPTVHVQTVLDNNRYVMEYLLDEILARQPAAIQKFLLETAILDRFCSSLCEAVTGVDDPTCNGQAYLEWMEQINLFIISLDRQRQWYRFHHLFRDLLLHKLKTEYSANDIARLHRRASRWLAEHGDLETAITHALAADDIELAASIIETRRDQLIKRENWPMLSRLLNRLPPVAIAQRPILLIAKAWERRAIGEYAAVDGFLDLAEALLAEQRESLDKATETELRGEINWLRAFQTWYSGNFEQALTLCHRTYELSSPDQFVYVIARQINAFTLQAIGRLHQARELLSHALNSGSGNLSAYPLTDWYSLFAANYLAGEWVEAERVARHFVTLFGDQPAQPLLNAAYFALGVIHYEWNDLDKARTYFDLVTGRLVYALTYQEGYICLALCHQAQGKPELARRTLEELLGFVGTTGRAHLLLGIDAMTAQLALLAGDTGAAIRWATSVELGPPTPVRTFPNEPHILQAKALIAKGTGASLDQAQQNLQAVLAAAEKSHNAHRVVEALAGQALTYAAQRDQTQALSRMERALRLAQPQGYLRTFVDYGPAMAGLIQELQPDDDGIEIYLQQLLAAFGQETAQAPRPVPQPLTEPLTDRELEILTMLSQRQAYKEIAAALVISPDTVKTHVSNIYRKLGVNRRQQAVDAAYALMLLLPPYQQA